MSLVALSGDSSRLRLLVMLGLLRSHCSTRFCCSLLHSGLQQPPELFCVISRSSPSPSPSSPPPPPPLAQPPIPAPSSCSSTKSQRKGRGEQGALVPDRELAGREAAEKEGKVEGRERSSLLPS